MIKKPTIKRNKAQMVNCLPLWLSAGLIVMMLLSGCLPGTQADRRGLQALEMRDYDQAVQEYLSALKEDPGNQTYRLRLNRARSQAALEHRKTAELLFSTGDYVAAGQEYELAISLDPSLHAAREGLYQVRRHLRARKLTDQAARLMRAEQQNQAAKLLAEALDLVADYQPALQLKETLENRSYALVDGVTLAVTSTEPLTLNFQKTDLPEVFKILSRLSGIGFILDEDIRDRQTSLYLEQASFAQALELLLRMNELDKKVLNSKTIILYPRTREKRKQFEDQIIQTFYLSHMDAKKAVNLLRTMLQVRKIYVQEDLNAIVLRDEPAVIQLAQKMIEANDRGSSEVVFDLELIEVNHNDTRELGLKLSNYSVGAGLSLPGSGLILDSSVSSGGDTTNLTDFTTGLDPFYSLPTAAFRFLKTQVNAEILANPQIRVRNGKKAKVHVGSREPVVTVTINDYQTSENVQYIDVGVKLDVEPIIKLDGTIETKLSLEVSNVSGRERTANGTAVITISSTNADTTLTLMDNEQTVIGGLIRNDNSVTRSKIPLFGDLPILGALFNGSDTNNAKREILLSITPHIVKSVRVPQGDTASIWSGGEDDLKFGRNFGTFTDDYLQAQELPLQPTSGEETAVPGAPAEETTAPGFSPQSSEDE